MEVFTVAPEAGKTYTSKKGYPCKSDRDIDNTTSQAIPTYCYVHSASIYDIIVCVCVCVCVRIWMH